MAGSAEARVRWNGGRFKNQDKAVGIAANRGNFTTCTFTLLHDSNPKNVGKQGQNLHGHCDLQYQRSQAHCEDCPAVENRELPACKEHEQWNNNGAHAMAQPRTITCDGTFRVLSDWS